MSWPPPSASRNMPYIQSPRHSMKCPDARAQEICMNNMHNDGLHEPHGYIVEHLLKIKASLT